MSQQESGVRRVVSAVGQLVLVVAIVVFTKTVAAEAYYVPSGSMQPTLLIGDELMVSKFSYGYSRYSLPIAFGPSSPERLFAACRSAATSWFSACRAIRPRPMSSASSACRATACRCATAGCGSTARCCRCGATAPELWRWRTAARRRRRSKIETLPGGREHPIYKFDGIGQLDNTQVFEVTPDHIFVMRDNRDDSADSRLAPEAGGVGLVPVENPVGRVDVVLGSWDLGVAHDPIWTWPSGLRLSRFFSLVN